MEGLRTLDTADEAGLEGPHTRALAPGTVVDRYVVEGVLGQGGVATVYKVRHQRLGTLHALKLLGDAGGASGARLLNEGKLQASWDHPNIVRVLDAFEHDGGLALLMEFVDGPDLARWLDDHPGGVDLALAEDLFTQLLDALEYAHARGVVHRDLKASNVLLERADGALVARVTDFGVAKILGGRPGEPHDDTRTGALLGTPAYMAPEQLDASSRVDTRADLFALGVMLYELCAGARPFQGPTVWALLDALRACSYVPLRDARPGVPEHLARAVEACLVREPDARAPDVATLRAILRGEVWAPTSGAPDAMSPAPPEGAAPRRAPRWPWLAAAACALGGGAAAGVAFMDRDAAREAMREAELREERGRVALETQRDAAALAQRAWRVARRDPAAALALLRARHARCPECEVSAGDVFRLRRAGGDALTFPATDEVLSVAASPASRVVAALGSQGRLQAWDLDTGRALFEVDARSGTSVQEVAFTDDGARLVVTRVGGRDPLTDIERVSRVFDSRTGEVLLTFAQGDQSAGVFFSRDGRWGATVDSDEGVMIWDFRNGSPHHGIDEVRSLALHGVAFSPDGATLAVVGIPLGADTLEMSLFLYDTTTWARTRILPLGERLEPKTTVAFSRDGRALLVVTPESSRAVDLATGEVTRAEEGRARPLLDAAPGRALIGDPREGVTLLTSPGLEPVASLDGVHDSRVLSARFVDGAPLLHLTSSDHTASLWSSRHGRPRGVLRGHRSWVLDATSFADAGGDLRLVTGGRDRAVKVWSLRDLGRFEDPFPDAPSWARAWSEDGGWALARGADGGVWSWRQGEPEASRLALPEGAGRVLGVRLHEDQGRAVVATSGAGCLVFDRRARLVQTFAPRAGLSSGAACLGLTWTARDGVLVRTKHTIMRHDPDTAAPLAPEVPELTHKNHRQVVFDDASRRGVLLVERRELVFLDAELAVTGRAHLGDHTVDRITPLGSGSGVLVTYWDGIVERWDVATGTRGWAIEGLDAVNRVHASPDGARAVVGTTSGAVHLVDTHAGRVLHDLRGHTMDVTSVRLSPDGARVAAAAKDGTVRVWSARTGELLDLLSAPDGASALRFGAPDTLRAWSSGGALVTWSLAERAQPDPLADLGRVNNLRVCPGSLEVVPVIPFPDAGSVWAPARLCAGLGEHDEVPHE
jgi:serine/threonine-protein kinase